MQRGDGVAVTWLRVSEDVAVGHRDDAVIRLPERATGAALEAAVLACFDSLALRS
jgi:hypothetical protein